MFILTKLSLLLVCFSLGGPLPGLAAAALLPFPCARPLPPALLGAAAAAADGRGSSAAGPSWLPRSDCLPLWLKRRSASTALLPLVQRPISFSLHGDIAVTSRLV